MLAIPFILISLLTFLSTSTAASIPSTANGLELLSPSAAISGIPPLGSMHPVDPVKFSDWAGEMKLEDCQHATALLGGRVAYVNPATLYTFWSRRWTVQPPGNEWELPFGARYGRLMTSFVDLNGRPLPHLSKFTHVRLGTCVLVFRMSKDFGSSVLPLADGSSYVDMSSDLPSGEISWHDLLLMTNWALQMVQETGRGLWTPNFGFGGSKIITLYLPRTSVMGRRWTGDMRAQRYPIGDLLWAANGTGSVSSS